MELIKASRALVICKSFGKHYKSIHGLRYTARRLNLIYKKGGQHFYDREKLIYYLRIYSGLNPNYLSLQELEQFVGFGVYTYILEKHQIKRVTIFGKGFVKIEEAERLREIYRK